MPPRVCSPVAIQCAAGRVPLTAAARVSIKFATMPTYEYVCSKCGHDFEKFQSMLDKPLATCPKELCPKKTWGKGKVKKKISSGAGLIFKGSGFYITDYRSEGYKESAKKDAEAAKPAAAAEPKAATTPEAKPAAKMEPKPTVKAESKPAKPARKK